MMQTAEWIAVVTLFLSICLMSLGRDFKAIPEFVGQPGIALEVPANNETLNAVLGEPGDHSERAQQNRYTAATAQYLDFYFIPCYVAVFVLAGLLQYSLMSIPWKWLGLLGVLSIMIAGACDVAENTGILRAIVAADQGWPMRPELIALWAWRKWTLVYVALLAVTPIVSRLAGRRLARSDAHHPCGCRRVCRSCGVWREERSMVGADQFGHRNSVLVICRPSRGGCTSGK